MTNDRRVLVFCVGVLAFTFALADPAAIDCPECDRNSGSSFLALLSIPLVVGVAAGVIFIFGFGPGGLYNLLRGRRWGDARGHNGWGGVIMLAPVVALVGLPPLALIQLAETIFGGLPFWGGCLVVAGWWLMVFRWLDRAREESKSRSGQETSKLHDSAKLSHPAQVCPSTTKIERREVLEPNPGQLRIREVTNRAVHGRVQIAPDEPDLQMTAEQRQAISDHVRLSNESAVEKARRGSVASTPAPAEQLDALDSPQARGAEVLPRPSEQQSSQDATEIKRAQDIALRRALANLAAASRERRADRRTQIERDVAALEQRGLSVDEVILELQGLERQLAAETLRQGLAK